ncbi:hypothetical protein GALMADRAFT_1158072 [Galerina marginata CBS 339.88]|uniref:Uncharacterized protein n=1 Tax=Galerina marginata (strain CBS 339.88) TaxID=685588 RepID=A0A067S679_GALM3|nr:hypothetical protein GALMADRAFT_1158072 [Galerina marginata CBS 339.88]
MLSIAILPVSSNTRSLEARRFGIWMCGPPLVNVTLAFCTIRRIWSYQLQAISISRH